MPAARTHSELLATHIRNAIGLSVEVVIGEPGKVERSAASREDLRGK
jgi:hypothetical protein